jgi:hypothetical protein
MSGRGGVHRKLKGGKYVVDLVGERVVKFFSKEYGVMI